jgi:STE24 endopeptidase
MTQLEKAPRVGRTALWWRALVAAPVMLGGLAVVVLVAGPLGAWAPVVPLAWLALAGVWLTRSGERVAVRIAYRYRRLNTEQAGQLRAAFAVAESRTKIVMSEVDVYVRAGTGNSINAYAAGRRSIAVSEGAIAAAADGRLTTPQVGALVAHELGHLQSRGTRYGLAIAWLGAPWRAVVAVLGGMLRLIVGKVPTARAGLVVLGPIVVAVAVVQGVQQHAWVPLAAMVTVGVLLIVQPLAAAALSRSGERAADAYAVQCGLGPELAGALQAFEQAAGGGRAWASHPPRERRIRELTAAAAGHQLTDAC